VVRVVIIPANRVHVMARGDLAVTVAGMTKTAMAEIVVVAVRVADGPGITAITGIKTEDLGIMHGGI
jgi:hypothetical protein